MFGGMVQLSLGQGKLGGETGFTEARLAGWVNKVEESSKYCCNASWGAVAATWSRFGHRRSALANRQLIDVGQLPSLPKG